MPSPVLDDAARRTAAGRLKMFAILLVCAAPVLASYFTYFVVRPQARSNYGDLIEPLRPIPAQLGLSDLQGQPVESRSLRGQWLLVVVAPARCDAGCEKLLWLQRQLRETLGREKERVDKVWLINDTQAVRPETLQAVGGPDGATVLRADPEALADWLEPAAGHALQEHLYLVDPMGNWMMRMPAQPDPAKVKRDVERLLRASASWDQPGR
jgi:cytochrome oxidase Cu insertion factor (SCO1/SenC/PrrC family)